MNARDTRYTELMIRLPRELLQALDAYAAAHFEGNRSQTIREAIRRLLASNASENTHSGPRKAKR